MRTLSVVPDALKNSQAAVLIVVVVLVMSGVVGAAVFLRDSSHSAIHAVNGVHFISSEVSCVPASQGLEIEARFEIVNTSPQDESVQVQLVAGSQVLTQDTYALGAAGTYDTSATGSISWNVSSCPSDVSLQLA